VALLLLVALGALSACQPAASSRPLDALPGVPAPTDAVVDLGGGTAAVDGDRQFVAYRSRATPAVTLKRFDAQLKAAGYRSVGRRTGWNCYVRADGKGAGDVILVYVEPDGPPTTLLVAAGTLADIATADGRTPGSATPGMGTPDPTSAVKTHKPGGQGPGAGSGASAGSGSGQGSAAGQGNGGGSGGAGSGGGQGSGGGSGSGGGTDNGTPKPTPTPRHATPSPRP
jgi:hypothetical protein